MQVWFCALPPSLNSVKLNLPWLILDIDNLFLSLCVFQSKRKWMCVSMRTVPSTSMASSSVNISVVVWQITDIVCLCVYFRARGSGCVYQ